MERQHGENSEEERREGQRKRQKLSKVWDHFKLKKDKNSVECVFETDKINCRFGRIDTGTRFYCKRALTFGDACIYQIQNPRGAAPPGAASLALVTLDKLGQIARPPRRRRVIRVSALSTFDGTLRAYHGDHG